MLETRKFCTFLLESQLFGIEVEKVQEVVGYREVTRVPLAGPIVRGLINLRGQIVTAVDLGRRLKLRGSAALGRQVNVVLSSDDRRASLQVDEIGAVLEVNRKAFEPLPESVLSIPREFIQGLYKLRSRLLVALDTERIIDGELIVSEGERE